jgi:NAD(P)-dependent dehydrogenase (short-subunit alcohol dehydrogenase family)
MADTPTAAFSLRIRVRMANKPGDLGRLAVAIGEVGGNIAGLDGFLAKQAFLEEDIIVDCRSEAHQAEVLTAIEALDGIDVLANCAGVFPVGALDAMTDAEYDRCFAVNVRAPFQLTRALAPAMAARGWGRIVNVGSSSAYAGFARTALYCASKHALLGLTRATHAEYRARGVRAYSVSPGSVKTAMGRDVPDQVWDTFLEPDEVAAYVAFVIGFDSNLVSEEVRLNRVLGPA